MEQWLIENMLWVGLGMGVILVGIKLLVVHFYRKLVLAEAGSSPDQE